MLRECLLPACAGGRAPLLEDKQREMIAKLIISGAALEDITEIVGVPVHELQDLSGDPTFIETLSMLSDAPAPNVGKYSTEQLIETADSLAPLAMNGLRNIILDPNVSPAARHSAIQTSLSWQSALKAKTSEAETHTIQHIYFDNMVQERLSTLLDMLEGIDIERINQILPNSTV